ncbi:hypothetical protein JQT66_14615 [Sulfitobacter mediterraneus]|uniref:LIC10280 family protein n=1 Tax=Sulfitobacter mediterraneus TaxID=83219 RepID=UPI0019343C81|nr:hypothetical protein [Sulfitobacter mediterraneus]MBM1311474.1 hypothetical protein [Sulfitobacter mediterraneus]MBM1315356.1 hypothetical protein [Sulfitobacter mediterraneus]MBM1323717.1 hypothetical protein [Sulfitobacter mediterraneus]MBM1327629.1 hypothetical protein [Sulfitobacter mediterraneus]MBM1398977.1 hypothetical protein [Sulfitobacter mediterraneus]
MSRSIFTRRAWIAGAMAACLAAPAAAQTIGISGVFTAEGRNPDGSAYSGVAVVNEQNGSVQVTWTVGSQTYAGSGVRDGQIVVVNWGQAHPVIYVVMANGNLHGTWQNGTALERLTRR